MPPGIRPTVTSRPILSACRAMSSTASTESEAVIVGTQRVGVVVAVDSMTSAGAPTSTPAAILACPATIAASQPGWVGNPRSGRQPSGESGNVPSSRCARV